MKKKVFLSYSHKDEIYFNALVNHLSIMQGQGLIHAWHDRQIRLGQDWKKKIDENLREADLILLLVSSDFFSSAPCMKEFKQAMLLRKRHGTEVIPIIVRECEWKKTEMGGIQAMRPKGKAVSSWENADEAWTLVAEGIREMIESMPQSIDDNLLSVKHAHFLENVGIPLVHKEVENVRLKDIFVYPDIQRINSFKDEDDASFSSTKLKEIYKEQNSRTLLIGEAQSGKTALCKMLYSHYHNVGCIPVWVDGKNIKTTNFSILEKAAVVDQYQGLSHQSLKAVEFNKKILMLENFQDAKLSRKACQFFLNNVENMYAHIIVTADDAFPLIEYDIKQSDRSIDLFKEFDQVKLKYFGHLLRGELITKWMQLGQQQYLIQNEKLKKIDKYTNLVNSILGRNFVPSYPLFLLSILQTFDATLPEDHRLTAYGHCYQAMIYIALQRARVKNEDIGTYLNFATELSYHMFRNNGNSLSSDELWKFSTQYAKIFNLSINEDTLAENLDTLVQNLHDSRILSKDENQNWSFGYDYIYYFFAGKYLAENLDSSEVAAAISMICNKIHITRYANILIFVAHHTHDFSVLDEIMANAICLFDGCSPASLHSSEVMHLAGLLRNLPRLTIERTDPLDERKKILKAQDQMEEQDGDSSALKEGEHEDFEGLDASNDNRFIVELNRAFKSIEVMGQILKNHHGSLKSAKLIEIFSTAQDLGLKIASDFFSSFKDEDHLTRAALWIVEHVDHENKMSLADREQAAHKLAAWILYSVSCLILDKLSHSLGSDKLIKVADEINEKTNTPASELINLSIHAWFLKKLSFEKVNAMVKKFKGNMYALRLLRAVVINHLYMHDVSREDRQRLGNILGISEKKQLLMSEKGQEFVKGKNPK